MRYFIFMPFKVSIVVLAYNNPDLLKMCLEHISLNEVEKEIIVIDNASSPPLDAFKEMYPEMIYIRLNQPKGFGAANNIGIQRSTGEVVLILNNDCFIGKDTLKILSGRIEGDNGCGAVGPKIFGRNGRIQFQCRRGEQTPFSMMLYGFGLYRIFPRNRTIGKYPLSYIDDDAEQAVFCLSGSCMMARRDVLEAVKGFDERFIAYSEEIDLCKRISKHGYKIIYYPRNSVLHLGGATYMNVPLRSLYLLHSSYLKYARKHFGRDIFTVYFYHFIVLFGFLFKLVPAVLRKISKRKKK